MGLAADALRNETGAPAMETWPAQRRDERLCSSRMKTLVIVYHSMTGGTRQMAHAAAAGAGAERAAVQTRVLRSTDAGPQDVLSADA